MSARPMRVAVTRDEPADGALSLALRRQGLAPVPCPVLVEAPPSDPAGLEREARRLASFDWLVVASARAVSALRTASGGAAFPATLRTAAAGHRTAAALAAWGAAEPLVAPLAGAHALAEALRGADRWPGRRALLPRALDGGRELGDALRSYGASVTETEAYRTVERPGPAIAAAWSEAAADAVVVASPSAARALVGAVGVPALVRLEHIVAIGATTAAALSALGVRAITPDRSDFESVADLLSGTPSSGREIWP
jgi:uroporphyrinogen-III synthase